MAREYTFHKGIEEEALAALAERLEALVEETVDVALTLKASLIALAASAKAQEDTAKAIREQTEAMEREWTYRPPNLY
jgi:hypothetical protein